MRGEQKALSPLKQLQRARAAISAEIAEDFALMQLLTARTEAREDVLRQLDLAISTAEEWAIGAPQTLPLRSPRSRDRQPGDTRRWYKIEQKLKGLGSYDPQRMAAAAALAVQVLGENWQP